MVLLYLFFVSLLVASAEQKVTISLNTTTLSRSGDSVQIQWSGIPDPSDLDWLGIYTPPNSTHDNFIGYLFLSSSTTWQSGYGQISLPLTDLRSDYSFRIFRWTRSEVNPKKMDHDKNPLPGTARLAAESDRVGFRDGRGPSQIHVAYTGKEDEMRVMFVTEDGGERRVRYAERVDALGEFETVARVGRYEREDMCDAPANESVGWRDPGFIHDAVMTGLKKGVKYYYQVGSDSGGWSETQSFSNPDFDSSDEITAFMFGDMGVATPYKTFIRTQDESLSTVKWILRDIEALEKRNKAFLVSHIGDISYARGYAWVWDEFFRQVEPIAARVPYHVCIGNHEYDWPAQPWRPDWAQPIYGKDSGGECGVPYSLRFHMPANSPEPTRNLFYSLDLGPVHFVYFSTETNFLPGSAQHDFLVRDLGSVNRTRRPFVVVQGHRPMYTTSSNSRDAPFTDRLRRSLEPVFVENRVSLALWGHVHRYERFCPMSNFTCGEGGGLPVHVVIGMAGQDWQPIWEPRPDHPEVPIFPQPERSEFRGGEFGYTRLVATPEKLTFSYVGNHDGEVHDQVVILASGKVVFGDDDDDEKVEEVESTFPVFVKLGSVLLMGAFLGYVIGYLSHARKRSAPTNNWTPVKSDET